MMGQERIITRLLVTFGGFALLLACSGLHGVTSYSVARRTNEIGIRVAGYHRSARTAHAQTGYWHRGL